VHSRAPHPISPDKVTGVTDVTDVTDVWTFARDVTSARSQLEAGRDRDRG